MITVTIKQIEQAIGIPVQQWKGKCYEIACLMIEENLVTGRPVYGHYLGKVAKTSHFGHRIHLPFQAHGWILLPDGKVMDPTRWVFEDVEPYLFVGDPDDDVVLEEYDEGGNKWRELMQVDPPAEDSEGHPVDLSGLDGNAFFHVQQLLTDIKYITVKHVFWLANLPPSVLGEEFIRDIYRWIVGIKHGAFIPLDNRRKYIGK